MSWFSSRTTASTSATRWTRSSVQARNLDDLDQSKRFRLPQSVVDIPCVEDLVSPKVNAELMRGAICSRCCPGCTSPWRLDGRATPNAATRLAFRRRCRGPESPLRQQDEWCGHAARRLASAARGTAKTLQYRIAREFLPSMCSSHCRVVRPRAADQDSVVVECGRSLWCQWAVRELSSALPSPST